jgi:outer membrane protein assembly factor BamB
MKIMISSLVYSLAALICASPSFGNVQTVPKTQVFVLSPDLDHKKPLGLSDYSGFIVEGDEIFGSVSDHWTVKYSLSKRKAITWYKTNHPLSIPVYLSGNSLVVANRRGEVIKFNRDDGRVVWKTRVQTYASKKIVADAGLLYVVDASGSVVAIDFETGQKKWLTKLSNFSEIDVRDNHAIAVRGRKLYVGHRKTVEVLNSSTGNKLGEYVTPAVQGKFGAIVGSLSFADGSLIFARYDGSIFCFDVDSYSELRWKRDLRSEITSLNFEGGILNVGTSKGKFYTMEHKTGKVLWDRAFSDSVSGSFAADRYIFVHTANGYIAKLVRSTGEVVWADSLNGRVFAEPFISESEVFYSTGAKNIYGYQL